MPFDAGFLAAVTHELAQLEGARVERIQQPDRDVIVLALRQGRAEHKLLVNAGSNTPRIQLTAQSDETPKVPPMFCMLLRKHILSAKLVSISQLGFERAVRLTFDTRDELGFTGRAHLIVELMGRFSDIILTDENDKIIGALKIIDFSDSQIRQIMPGLKYSLPPLQPMTADASAVLGPADEVRYKLSPLETERAVFMALRENTGLPDDKFICAYYYGISATVAREIAYRARGGGAEKLWDVFSGAVADIKEGRFTPCAVRDAEGKQVEYSFLPLTHYGSSFSLVEYGSFGELMDDFFAERDTIERYRQRASDLHRILSNAEARLTRKIALQQEDLAACKDKEKYKAMGDLITSNLYRLKHGDSHVTLIDYTTDPPSEVTLELDPRLTPAQNAQKYYKRYAKAKSAEVALTEQIRLAREELEYIAGVADALSRARSEAELAELRRELYESGYASRMKNYVAQKTAAPKPQRFRTSGGFEVLCGKNNIQNEYVTFRLASKNDMWFHVKGMPGSHVVLCCNGKEPGDSDLTEAAVIAATYSKAAEGIPAPVDYTQVKNVKKPPGSKPGYVTYRTNRTAYVAPDEKLCERLKI
jgi:predicted ribosome quality control (RQC) complex YloA/Tae2 family protein